MNPNRDLGRVKSLGAIATVLVLLLCIAYGLAIARHLGPFVDAQTSGLFGDAFGALTSLFNALAFVGLLMAILLQRQDLRFQQEELQLQREEIVRTRGVLDEQRDQMESQARALNRQVFEASFFRLLESLRKIVESVESQNGARGVTAMHQLAVSLRDMDSSIMRGPESTPIDAGEVVKAWYPTYRHHLAPYFDLLRMALEFIDGSEVEEKVFYTDILRATLSPGELFLVFHYGVTDSAGDRFKTLLERYGLLETFDPEQYDLRGARRIWYRACQIPRKYAFR